ncbi:MAG: glycosyltransferase family 39 protein, partial [Chloroflexi bacterium]|nr:glycosyltransferase family 39 protein [Chloroflexota bacterium]
MQTYPSRPSPADLLARALSWTFTLAVLATRWPVRTQWLFNWDAANFALALRHFDVRLHQPQPPGYPLFVLAGRVMDAALLDANAALTFVSMVMSAVAVVALYWVARTMSGERVGRWAGILLLTSVTFWSYGGMALAYTALAAFSALTALLAFRARFLGKDRLWLIGSVYALGGGFRPDLMLFLAPLVLLAAWGKPLRNVALGAAATLVVFTAWFAPTVMLSGGPAEYLAVFSAYGSTDVIARYSSTALGMSGLTVNVRDTFSYVFYALYFTAVLIPVAVLGLALAWRKSALVGEARPFVARLGFLALWTAPMLAFYLIVHVGDPGYIFSFLPALLLAIAWGWEAAPVQGGPRFRLMQLWAGVVLVAALNAAV